MRWRREYNESVADFERKGVDIAYKAINNLINEGYQINLYIVCSINEDTCKDKLKKTAGTKTLPNWVCFLPPRQDIATYYRAIDIFTSPSREEDLPMRYLKLHIVGAM